MAIQNGHLFISYRSIERDFAFKLANSLLENGYSVWMDKLSGILPGDSWPEALEKGVNNAVGVISVLSLNYIDSDWCMRELFRASSLKKPIIPARISEIPKERWPMVIQERHYANFTKWQESPAEYDKAFQLLLKGILRNVKTPPGTPMPPAVLGPSNPERTDPEDRMEQDIIKAESLQDCSGFTAIKARALRNNLQILEEEYEAIANQYRISTQAGMQVHLKYQMTDCEKRYKAVEAELKALDGC